MKEKEISFVDLCIEILLHWRSIIVISVLGGIMCGALSYVQSTYNSESNNAPREQDWTILSEEELVEKEKELTNQLTERQYANVIEAIGYEQLYMDGIEYQKISPIMQMNPLSVPTVDLIYYIQSDNLEKSYNLKEIYKEIMNSPELYDYVEERCGVDSSICNEIIFTDIVEIEMTTDRKNSVIQIRIMYKDIENSSKIAETIKDYIRIEQNMLNDLVGNHEMILLKQSEDNLISNIILEHQNDVLSNITSAQNAYIKLEAAFTDKERQYYNLLTQTKEYEEKKEVTQENITVSSVRSVNKKFIVLGMMGCTVVYIIIIFLKYILNNKIQISDNLEELYGIPHLATVSSLNDINKEEIIRRHLWNMRCRNFGCVISDAAVNYAIVEIGLRAKKQGIESIYLVGEGFGENTYTICEQIERNLKDMNIRTQILDNILRKVEMLEKLKDAEGIVLVETAGDSRYEDVLKELKIINGQELKILGGVIVK